MNFKVFFKILGLFSAGIATAASAASEYQSTEPYGNAQTPCFRGAVVGGSTHLSPEEEARLLGSLPIKEEKHFYGRLGVNSGSVSLSGLKSVVNNNTPSPFLNGSVAATKARNNQTALELALGYFYSKNTRLEVEALFNKSFNYSAMPALTFPPGTPPANTITSGLNANLKNMSLLFNGYYECMFGGYDRFHPFLMASMGLALNSAQTTLSTTAAGTGTGLSLPMTRTKRKGSLAIGGGFGFRFVIFSRVSLFASLRYISLGRMVMEPYPGFRVKGNYSMAPVSLGLVYLF